MGMKANSGFFKGTLGQKNSKEKVKSSNYSISNKPIIQQVFNADVKVRNTSFDSFPKVIHEGKQGKHIPGHNNFQKGKSELTISIKKANILIRKYSGKGKALSSTKERVDFGEIIGIYVEPETNSRKPTTVGIIHYSKSGAHIVPAKPKEEK